MNFRPSPLTAALLLAITAPAMAAPTGDATLTLNLRAQATLAFPEPGRVAGNGSCNRFFGSYTLINDRIAFGQMGSTRMACMGAVAEQESRYMAALQKAQRVQMQGSTLLLSVEGQDKPLRFSRTKP